MASTVTSSSLWKSAFARPPACGSSEAVDRLQQAFARFRERSALLVAEIHAQLPDLTVHDISHLDSLWEIGSLVAGSKYKLTPTEAFVFGGAVLLHDAGMALAAYPEGVATLREMTEWKDGVQIEFEKQFGRQPTKNELKSPPRLVENHVIAVLLRNLHARQSERLATTSWKAKGESAPQLLIEDSEIRLSFGRLIGLIAHSHWWPVERLEKEFGKILGAPHWCPNTWTIDPLRIACLLRLADAAHIDGRRAPSFLRALRRPLPGSDIHWKFQEKLQKPHLDDDALVYTSGSAFPFSEASAWWLCWDTLSGLDRELRQVDALLADKHLTRFAARRVAGVESPERIVPFIPTEGWLPIDAHVQVSDVPKLVLKMGGTELYGRDLSVPLRELVQNSVDAVKARRVLENRGAHWGRITVRLGKDDKREWLEVEDDGVGMSEQVLRRYLLDFGNSYWGSPLMLGEYPGLLATGMKPVGQYGIGFFSVFMLGAAVRVRTRRFDASQDSTLVMEFNTSLTTRPVVRRAEPSEFLRDGGTAIRVWLDVPSRNPEGFLAGRDSKSTRTLRQLCRNVCPCLDVSLWSSENGREEKCLDAGDWITCEPMEFLRRLPSYDNNGEVADEKLLAFAPNMRLLQNRNGEIVGRGCLTNERFIDRGPRGMVTVGGLRACSLTGIIGVLAGAPNRASRDAATPMVEPASLASWATEQAKLASDTFTAPSDLVALASFARRCGGDTGELPIVRFRRKWWSFSKLAGATDLPEEIYLVSPFDVDDYEKLSGFRIADNVLVTEVHSWSSIVSSRNDHEWPGWPDKHFLSWKRSRTSQDMVERTLGGLAIEALALAWGSGVRQILANSNFRERKALTIGKLGGETIRTRVSVVRKGKTGRTKKRS